MLLKKIETHLPRSWAIPRRKNQTHPGQVNHLSLISVHHT